MEFFLQQTEDGSYTVTKECDNLNTRTITENDPAYQEWLKEGNVAQIRPYVAPPGPDLEALKASKQREFRDKADAFLGQLGEEYGVYERATWPTQSVEAKALVVDPGAEAPMVRKIALERSMDVLDLAKRIIANEQVWGFISGSIVGQRLAYQDKLNAVGTPEGVIAIVVEYKMPSLV